jgi:HEAT repeat protein
MDRAKWIADLPRNGLAFIEEKKLVPFLYSQRVVAAIRFLSQVSPTARNSDDLKLIHRRLHDANWSTVTEAAKALRRIGTEADVASLLDAMATTTSIAQRELLATACALGGPETVSAAAVLADQGTASVVVPFLSKLDSEALQPLLNHPVEAIRVGAAGELCKKLSRSQLEILLNDYTGADQYFYNVVVVIDEFLYGPTGQGEE